MKHHALKYILTLALVAAVPMAETASAAASEQTSGSRQRKAKAAERKPIGKSTGRKATGKAKTSKKSSGKSSRRKNARPAESKAEMSRREQETRREIKLTQEEIARNDKEIKTGLADLSRISSEIGESKKQVASMASQVKGLDSRIAALGQQIARNEDDLAKLRANYLRALKKLRLSKNNTSSLAFVFAADNFNQALRRMRYLKRFSEWRDKQTADIEAKVSQLKTQSHQLAIAKNAKDHALRGQMAAQSKLEQQHRRQDAIVTDLRKKGSALQGHLAKKQAEANDLKNRIAALIAEEQRRAAEEERRREAERLEAERRAAEKIEAERKAAEEQALALASEKKESGKEKAEKQSAKSKKKEQQKQSKPNDKKSGKTQSGRQLADKGRKNQKSGGDYASARKRRPRGATDNQTVASANAKGGNTKVNGKTAANFEAARGSLPRPVSGAFRVTSAFGRHPLPELPDVMYDNPGIDAEVSAGASATAVFGGRVSGVYMLPGYNTVIIVNHGNYYTVYGNIASPSAKVGDSVKQGDSLGKLATDPDNPGHSIIHFEVWRNRDKLNPSDWIR